MTLGQKEKLIKRLKSKPRDYKRSDKGRTSSSRVMITGSDHAPILLHKPHPRKELLEYQVKQLIETLVQEGLI